MADIEIYSTDYGQKLQVRTWQSNIATASAVVIALKSFETPTTATTLTASVVTSYPAGTEHDPIAADEYAVEAAIPSAWGATRVGKWVATVRATYAAALVSGDPFTLEVKANPAI